MTRRPTLLATLLAIVLALAPAGCSTPPAPLPQSGPVTLPEDPLCDVFPADQITPMLPAGTYQHSNDNDFRSIYYLRSSISADGNCQLNITDPDNPKIGLFVSVEASSSVTTYSDTCRDGDLDVTPPPVGTLLDSGYCVTSESAGADAEAWASYWGGRYVFDKPRVTLITASVYPGKDYDPAGSVPDAAHLVQMVLDFITDSYQADPSAAVDPTTAPGAIPLPSPTEPGR